MCPFPAWIQWELSIFSNISVNLFKLNLKLNYAFRCFRPKLFQMRYFNLLSHVLDLMQYHKQYIYIQDVASAKFLLFWTHIPPTVIFFLHSLTSFAIFFIILSAFFLSFFLPFFRSCHTVFCSCKNICMTSDVGHEWMRTNLSSNSKPYAMLLQINRGFLQALVLSDPVDHCPLLIDPLCGTVSSCIFLSITFNCNVFCLKESTEWLIYYSAWLLKLVLN